MVAALESALEQMLNQLVIQFVFTIPVSGSARLRARGLFLEQGSKARLFEVVIPGQRVSQAMTLHDDEGNAIGQGPLLVRAGIVQVDGPSVERFIRPNQASLRTLLKIVP